MESDGDARKLCGVFDQPEQLTAPGAPSGPSDSNGGPDLSGILQRHHQSLIAIRERILLGCSVGGFRNLHRTCRFKEIGEFRVALSDSLDHRSEGAQRPERQRKAGSPKPSRKAEKRIEATCRWHAAGQP